MGSYIGILKIAAKKTGLSYEEYIIRIKTQKWCCKCKSWKERNAFGVDNSKWDKLRAFCSDCIRVKEKKSTKGRVSFFKGKTHSEATIKLLKELKKGAPSPMKGKNHSIETRDKISKNTRENTPKGEKCHFYIDGRASEREEARLTKEYKRWRYDVYLRDNFTCQKCGDNRGGNLNAHHIKPFAIFPDLRLDINNGVTLCEICHDDEHKKMMSPFYSGIFSHN